MCTIEGDIELMYGICLGAECRLRLLCHLFWFRYLNVVKEAGTI